MVKAIMDEVNYFKDIFNTSYWHTSVYSTVTFINVNNENLYIDRRYHAMSEIKFIIMFKTKATEQKIFRSKELIDILVEVW